MQAIQTKFIPAANVKGSRVKAWCEAKSATFDWDHRLGPSENHRAAARALAAALGWSGQWAQGGTSKSYVFVNIEDERDLFTVAQ